MVISHVQPFLFLFVSIFFLPAALGTAIEFSSCLYTTNNKDFVNITKLEIIPYPIRFHENPIFKITCAAQSLAERGRVTVNVDMLRSNTNFLHKEYDICSVTKCPIEPGTFVITSANMYDVQRDNHLSGEYIAYISIQDLEGSIETQACVSFMFHANALAEFTNIPILNGVSVSKVEIFPYKVTVNDNPVFRITANTTKTISSNSTVSARMVFEGGSELIPRSSRIGYKLCDSTKHCPVVPGGFELAFPHPYWRYKMEAGRYRVEVQIVDQKFPWPVSMHLLFWFSVSEA